MTAASQLLVGPAHPGIPRTQVAGGSRPAQQRQPNALILRHVTQMLSHHRGIFQVVTGRDDLVPLRSLPGPDQPKHYTLQDGLFRDIGQSNQLRHA